MNMASEYLKDKRPGTVGVAVEAIKEKLREEKRKRKPIISEPSKRKIPQTPEELKTYVKEKQVETAKPTTVKKNKYKNIVQYKLQLLRIITSPFASKETKTEARSQYQMISRYGKRGYKTKKTDEGFQFYKEPEQIDVLEWQKQRHKDIGDLGQVTGFASRFMAQFADPKTIYQQWIAPIGTDPIEPRIKAAMWEYQATEFVEKGDWFNLGKQVASSPIFSNILIPFAGGAIAGKIIGGLGTFAGKIGTGTKLGKSLLISTKAIPIGITGTAITFEGKRVLDEFNKSPEQGKVALSESLIRFTSAYAGVKWATSIKSAKEPFFKEEVLIKWDQGRIIAVGKQSYFELFGKKFTFGKPYVGISKSYMMGKPDYASWGMETPKGLDQPLFKGYRPVGAKEVQVSTYQNKVFFDTGKGWQMRTGIPMYGEYTGKQLSSIVWPKFMKRTWYNIYGEKPVLIMTFDYSEYFGIKIKPNLGIKGLGKGQGKTFTAKDVLGKPSKDLSGGFQVQKGGTITIQKMKPLTEQIKIQKIKNLYDVKTIKKIESISMFKPSYQQRYDFEPISLKASKSQYDFFTPSLQIQQPKSMQEQLSDYRIGFAPISISASALKLKLDTDYGFDIRTLDYSLPKITKPIDISFPSEEIIKTIKPKIPEFPKDETGKRKKKMFAFPKIDFAYHEREYSPIKIEETLNIKKIMKEFKM